MKKIIAMLLVLTMVLSFAACGKKTEEPVMTVPVPTEAVVETEAPVVEETEPVVEETEPVVEETEPEAPAIPELVIPTAEMPADEAVAAEKQSTYETVFADGLFTMDADAFSMNFANIFKMTVMADAAGKSLVEVAGAVEGMEMSMTMYSVSEDEVYYHRVGAEEGVAVDEWYKLEAEEGASVMEGTGFTTSEDLTAFKDSIQTVTYKGEWDGKDVVEVTYLMPEEETDFESEFEIEVEDETETEAEPTLVSIVLILDPETYAITTMYTEADGMLACVDFMKVEDLSTVVELPADITETLSAEEATMELAMGMMMFIFSAADMG